MNGPDLSPHALTSLVAIADHGSLSAAARHRNLTQPSLSRQVQELEAKLNTQLVERGAHGARLTPAGETLAEGAREVISLLSSLPDRVHSREGEVSGRIRLGTVDSVGRKLARPSRT
ncbi:MAG: LysR family transcriptional regulator [Planctomycetes bacterium]|nr:LysR family transcriptional regulator [Planctomycetota bacterium]